MACIYFEHTYYLHKYIFEVLEIDKLEDAT
jgi:hypothetical protein